MCQMRGYTPREFKELLSVNGWKFSSKSGSHIIYKKDGINYHVTFVDKGSNKGKELSRPMTKRIIKEANLVEKIS